MKNYTRYKLSEWDLKILNYIVDREATPKEILLFRFPEIKKQLKNGEKLEEILKNKSQYLHRKGIGHLWKLKNLGLIKKAGKHKSRYAAYSRDMHGLAKLWKEIQLKYYSECVKEHKRVFKMQYRTIPEDNDYALADITNLPPEEMIYKDNEKYDAKKVGKILGALEKNMFFYPHIYAFFRGNICGKNEVNLYTMLGRDYVNMIRDVHTHHYMKTTIDYNKDRREKYEKFKNMKQMLDSKEFIESEKYFRAMEDYMKYAAHHDMVLYGGMMFWF